MEKNVLISELRAFLIDESACQQVLQELSERAEISIVIADRIELSVFQKDQIIHVEERKAVAPDFIFKAAPQAIEVLIGRKQGSVAQLGVLLIKQIVGGDISVSMPANLLQVTQKGYLNIIKAGGIEFLAELQKHNLTSIPKIISALKKLKKS